MKIVNRVQLLAALALSVGVSLAQQINVKLTLAYNVYIVGEPVLVQIDALNATRDIIDAGSPESRDHVLVEITKDGQYNPVKTFNDEPVAGAFQLKPSQTLRR